MRIPVATYRLQVNADFTLPHAAAIVDYLQALGISDLYLSPIFEAVPGSTHGYDVTDPTRVRSEAGGRAALDVLSERVRQHGMGVLLDIVPNHMAASEHSPWWRDVLRHGPASRYAGFFDIDWNCLQPPGRLLLPWLGAPLADVLARAELSLVEENGEWAIDLGGRLLPVALERCPAGLVAEYREAAPARRREILRLVLACQHYQLEHWEVAGKRLGYRRFFDITDLAAVCVEREDVFAATHQLPLELIRSGQVTGLRIDHVDGLTDPAGYLDRLRSATDTYIVVEKILERNEPLPAWPVEGTTGYDFLNLLNGVFIDPEGYTRIERAYQQLTGDHRSFPEVVREKKLVVLDRLFGGERAALTAQLQPLLGKVAPELADRVLVELTVALPVYRTYVRTDECSERDRALLERVLSTALAELTDLPADARRRLRAVLLLEDGECRPAALHFMQRWQQLTGPVMAKGLEDTALYVHTAFISANEVGGNPATGWLSVADFHDRMVARAQSWPFAQSTTATHDTKRGEDARARLNVLSELAEWPARLREWASRGEEHKVEAAASAGYDAGTAPVPNAREESLLYQTLLGVWPMTGESGPDFIGRVKQYMLKALREAKESTSWRRPDPDFESFLAAFVDHLLDEPWWPALREEIRAYAGTIAWHGALNSLAQTLLKITCPGVPDFYQGTELWSLSLVDPDNRQPVDYEARRAALRTLEPLLSAPSPAGVSDLLRDWRTGTIKLYLTAAALRFRRRHAPLYARGAYLPLAVRGTAAAHLLAFARIADQQVAVTVAPRLLASLSAPGELPDALAWGNTEIELPDLLRGRAWRNVLTGEGHPPASSLQASALLRTLPLALLETGPA